MPCSSQCIRHISSAQQSPRLAFACLRSIKDSTGYEQQSGLPSGRWCKGCQILCRSPRPRGQLLCSVCGTQMETDDAPPGDTSGPCYHFWIKSCHKGTFIVKWWRAAIVVPCLVVEPAGEVHPKPGAMREICSRRHLRGRPATLHVSALTHLWKFDVACHVSHLGIRHACVGQTR